VAPPLLLALPAFPNVNEENLAERINSMFLSSGKGNFPDNKKRLSSQYSETKGATSVVPLYLTQIARVHSQYNVLSITVDAVQAYSFQPKTQR
jgi:hypothetical protein